MEARQNSPWIIRKNYPDSEIARQTSNKLKQPIFLSNDWVLHWIKSDAISWKTSIKLVLFQEITTTNYRTAEVLTQGHPLVPSPPTPSDRRNIWRRRGSCLKECGGIRLRPSAWNNTVQLTHNSRTEDEVSPHHTVCVTVSLAWPRAVIVMLLVLWLHGN